MLGKVIKLIVLPLLLGILIYLFFRGNDIIIYSWLPILKPVKKLIGDGCNLNFMNRTVREYVIFSLPDGLWLYSFTCSMILIWNKSASKFKYLWIFTGEMLALTHEIGQGLGWFTGTFDVKDLITYLISPLIAVIVSKKFFKEVT